MNALANLLRRDDTTSRRIPVYATNLFFSLHYAAILYVNSSLLSGYFSSLALSSLYVAGALGNSLIFLKAPRIISKIGNRALFVVVLVICFITTMGLALSTNATSLAFFFVLYESVAIMAYYSLDIFLEAASENNVTGEIRGIDVTIANAAILFGPLLVAIYATDGNYLLLYIASSLLLLPVIWFGLFSFKTFRDGETLPLTHSMPFRAWLETRNVKGISLARLSLEFFYALMAIYIPIYLHLSIGFSWYEIGVMFTIMLLPFIIFQIPAGDLADKRFGEKEILTLGFFIMGLPLLFMPFFGKSFLIWTVALFITRIGASLVEVMSDAYFFKKVDKRDTGLISIFRLMRPVAIVIGGAVGGVALVISSFNSLFFILALVTLWGMLQGLRIVDTK